MFQNKQGKIVELFVSLKNKQKINPQEIQLDGDGVIEDKFYAKGSDRSVLIASTNSYDLAKENDIDLNYGSLGENILVDFNPYNLTSGDRLMINNVILEITQNCTICNSLSKHADGLPALLKSDRGIFAKTVQSGSIKKGDSVKVIYSK